MTFSEIPPVYFPTKMILVDDQKQFCKSMQLEFFASNIVCQTFSDVDKALAFFSNDFQALITGDQKLVDYVEHEASSVKSATKKMVSFDFQSATQKIIYNPERFVQTCVLIVDQNMPKKTGLELAEQLRALKLPLRIIMLTGNVDDDVGVAGMNASTINQFYKKDSSLDDDACLTRAVQAQCQHVFKENFNFISQALAKSAASCLSEACFVSLFNELCEQHEIVEFYLWDVPGSFLLLSKTKAFFLGVVTEASMKKYEALLLEEEVSAELLNPIKTRQKAPFFLSDAEWQCGLDDWPDLLAPIKPLPGMDGFYYTVIEDLSAHDIDTDKILFYGDFLNEYFS